MAPMVHSTWQQLTTYLGLLRNDGKDAEGTCVEVLGVEIEIDTLRMLAILPAGKLAKAHNLITTALSRPPKIIAIALAIDKWAPHWRHATVVIHTDNTTAEAGFTKGYTRVGPAITSIRSALL
ncbi:hypothetical protein E4U58_007240 [Claviceps cyperi]|nr:hypothetical protein E4U58_007240 [Claviceps cyperi]